MTRPPQRGKRQCIIRWPCAVFFAARSSGVEQVVVFNLCSSLFLPAAGNFNGTSYNNGGSNGNYWSSTLYSSTNGRNPYFDSGDFDPQGNYGRSYGFSVRAVRAVSE